MLSIEDLLEKGAALVELQNYAAALDCYETALARDNDHLASLHHLGLLYKQVRHLSLARAYFERILEIDPNHVHALLNLGMTLKEHLHFSEALPFLRRAAALAPNYGLALGQVAYVTRQACNWASLDADDAAILEYLHAEKDSSLIPFNALSIPAVDGPAQKAIALRYAQTQLGQWLLQPPLVSSPPSIPHTRLRIGYISADFHEHPTVQLLGGVMAAQSDQGIVDVYVYSYGAPNNDRARLQVQASCHVFEDINMLDHKAAARKIADDEIDILIDLKGYTQNSRLEIQAQRPAPVIVSWLGYPVTLGHPRLADYIIGDPSVTPQEHTAHYSEKIAQMPHCYQPNDRLRQSAPPVSRHDVGLPQDALVFCSFNQAAKINPETFDTWCRLLRAVPDSVLWLLAPTAYSFAQLQREALKRGVRPQQLLFASDLPVNEHLARLPLADIALDTFPYTSHTTASDALWAGVPIVSRAGDTFASRVTASILRAAKLAELIATDDDDYFQRVYQLASDVSLRRAIQQKIHLAKTQTPLFDAHTFANDLTDLLQTIWQDYLTTHAAHTSSVAKWV